MSALDFIKIRGLDGEPGDAATEFFEIFQGAGGSDALDASTPSGTVGAGDTLTVQSSDDTATVSNDVWNAQTAVIQQESAYLDELDGMFKEKQQAVPKKTDLLNNILDEIIEFGAGKLASLLVLAKTGNPVLAEIAGFAAEIAISQTIQALDVFFQKGQDLCGTLKDENTALDALENSVSNYTLRREALKLHTEQIENLLHHVHLLEQQLVDTLGSHEGTSDAWGEWIASMEENTGQIAEWLQDAFAAADTNYDDDPTTENLPVPTVPTLPTLPPSTDPKVIAFWYLMKFGSKVVIELIKNWVEKGHGKNHEEMLQVLKDLKYNDEMLDLGGVRVWLKNKVISYG